MLQKRAGVSKRQLVRWRQEPNTSITLGKMIRVLRALREITGKPIHMTELFDLEPDNWNS